MKHYKLIIFLLLWLSIPSKSLQAYTEIFHYTDIIGTSKSSNVRSECISEPVSINSNNEIDYSDINESWLNWERYTMDRMMELVYKDGKLNIFFFFRQYWTEPNIELFMSGDIIFISPYLEDYDCVQETTCMARAHAVLEIPEGQYTVISSFGKQRVNLKNGVRYNLVYSQYPQNNWIVRKDAEWVYYNAGYAEKSPTIIRMRICSDNGKNILKYCIGDFDYASALPLAEVTQTGDEVIFTSIDPEEKLPSILFGASETWPATTYASQVTTYNATYSTWLYTADGLRKGFDRPDLIEITHETVDGRDALLYHYANGFKYLEGVGPIGDDYASNLAHPATKLDDDVVPTHFLYMRDLTDNHIIYGDHTPDPSYNSSAAVNDLSNSTNWYDTPSQLGLNTDGYAKISIYSFSGTLVYQAEGHEGITIDKSELPSGIYIAHVFSKGAMESHKVLIR